MSTLTVPAVLPRQPRPTAVRPHRCPPAPARRPDRSSPTVARPPVRLTRRGRLAISAALVLAGTGLLGLAAPQALAFAHPDGPATTRITVRPGETLWAIADRVAPGTDPRDTIARIESMNHLASSTVPAGSVLVVPLHR